MTDSTDPAPRITDLSSIEPENFKFRNTQFLRADGHHYDNPHDESFLEQREEIWRVRNGDLERVLEEFQLIGRFPNSARSGYTRS